MNRNRKPQPNRTPAAWQLDPSNIETETVQFWVNGVMITGQMTRREAVARIRAGCAFVISGQAIGRLEYGKMAS